MALIAALALGLFAFSNAAAVSWGASIAGRAMDGCGADPDDSGGRYEPCFSQWLSGVSVTLERNGQVLARTSTDGLGDFGLEAPGPGTYEVVGGGACGEQPVVPVQVPSGLATDVTLFYPNDGDDSPYATCPAAPPSIDGESVSSVTPNDATVEAQINPQDLEKGVLYQFQVVLDSSEYLSEFACNPERFPGGSSLCLGIATEVGALPVSGISPGLQDQAVRLNLASAGMTLNPGTTYHYRVIAARDVLTVDTFAWEGPIQQGPDQTFTTAPPGAPGGTGAGGPVEFEQEPWNMEGAARAGAEASRLEAEREAAARRAEEQARLAAPLVTIAPLQPTAPKPKPLTRAQKLTRALKACKRKRKKLRASCVRLARYEYGALHKRKR